MALWLPVMTVTIWTLAIFWVIGRPALFGFDSREEDWAWSFDVCPFYCLCIAAAICGIRFSRTWLVGKDRKTSLPLCTPANMVQSVRERLLGDGIALFGTLCGVSLMHLIWLFRADHGLLFHMAATGLASGYTNLREVLSWALGVPIVAGIAAWICMGLAYRLMRRAVVLIPAAGAILYMLHGNIRFGNRHLVFPPDWSVWIPLSLTMAFSIGAVVLGLRQKAISAPALVHSCLLWAGLTLAFYPFGPHIADGHWFNAASLLVSAAAGASMIVPYYAAILDFSRKFRAVRDGDNTAFSYRAPVPTSSRLRRARWVGLVGVAVLVGWVRWPAEPAVRTLWRSQGLVATPQELNTLYPEVNGEENLALKCLEVYDRYQERLRNWVPGSPPTEVSNATSPYEFLDRVLTGGRAKAKRDEPAPPDTLRLTRDFWNAVGRDTARDLHQIADSGLMKSRYPVDLAQGFMADARHIVPLKLLVQVLGVEATLAAVDKNSAQVADAIHAMIPIINSLDGEPSWYNQAMRMDLLSKCVKILEFAMGHTRLSDAGMRRLQEDFAAALPPLKDGHIMDKVTLYDQVLFTDDLRNPVRTFGGTTLTRTEYGWRVSVYEALGLGKLELLTLLLNTSNMLAWSRVASLTQNVDLAALDDSVWTFQYCRTYPDVNHPRQDSLGEGLSWRFALSRLFLPPRELGYQQEWWCRTELNLVRTALAVQRFRAASGSLPSELKEIVPAYLEFIPEDPWNPGHGLSYRICENGDSVVYSFGYNRADDGGRESTPGLYLLSRSFSGDITFTISSDTVADNVD